MKIPHVRSFWLVEVCHETLPRKLASSLHDIQELYAIKVMTEVGDRSYHYRARCPAGRKSVRKRREKGMSLIRRGGPKSIFRLVNDLAAGTGYKEATLVVWEVALAEIPI